MIQMKSFLCMCAALMLCLTAAFAGDTRYVYNPKLDGVTVTNGAQTTTFTTDKDVVVFGNPLVVATETTTAAANDEPAQFVTTWTGADGLAHQVITKRNGGETPIHFAGRHHDYVEALKTLYPPAPLPNSGH